MEVLLMILGIYLGVGLVVGVVLGFYLGLFRLGWGSVALALGYWMVFWLPHLLERLFRKDEEEEEYE